jgi:hypothetical protein
MHLADGGEAGHIELIGQADQRWPETAMNKGDLAVEQAARENLGRGAEKACDAEDVATGWV